MAFLYRRKKRDGKFLPTWWVCIERPGMKPLRESTGTDNKQLADKWLTNKKQELWKERELGIKPDKLFVDFVDVFLEEKRVVDRRKQSTLDGYEKLLNWWVVQFKGKNLREITQTLIVDTIKIKEKEKVAGATCNRYLAVLRTLLNLAHGKHQLIASVPTFFMYQEPKARVRWLKPWEIVRLLNALPPHLRDMAEFSLATGLRQGNVKGLRWSEVDVVARTVTIEGIKMKNGETFSLPLSQVAVDVLVKQIGKHSEAVFTYNGKPISYISNEVWKKALEVAGIENFRWHDLRHTWATMLIQAGVPSKSLQVLGAWETPSMVDKYAHMDTDSLRPFADLAAQILSNAHSGTQTPSEESSRHLVSVA